MTKEEAVKMLRSKMDGNIDTSYERAETVRMAIKALELEPCEDCVSRGDVLDILEDTYNDGGLSYRVYSDMFDLVDTMPSVTPTQKKGKWIKIDTEKKFNLLGDIVRVSDYRCSECGRIIDDIGTDALTNRIEKYPYCHCGSKNNVEE